MLFHLLGNRVYIGETVHKGTAHPGEREPIIDPELWEAVQQRIAVNSVERKTGRNSRGASLLAGIIVDGNGRRMSPSHAVKSGRRYRYYITHASASADDRPAWRMPARDVEAVVVYRLTSMLRDRSALRELVGDVDATALASMFTRAAGATDRLENSTYHRRTIVASIVRQVRLLEDGIAITLVGAALANRLDTPIASASGQCRKRLGQLFGIAYLAPDIVAAILQGRQPPALSARTLLTAKLPLAWDQQKKILGFA